MVTTNLPFEWTEVLGSERLTGATLDRLTHWCKLIETMGECFQLQGSRFEPGGRPTSTWWRRP